MMTELSKHQKILQTNLHPAHYFQSLLQEAHRVGLLDDRAVEHIQMQIVQLLARLTQNFTGGASSSVRVETAQTLLHSALYTIGARLKTFPNPDLCAEALQKEPLEQLFRQGKQLLEKQVKQASHLLQATKKNATPTQNISYHDTLDKGLDLFFEKYNVAYAAHEVPASIDYPLCGVPSPLVGVAYLLAYLKDLFLENSFCAKFDPQAIHFLMRGVDEGYADLLVNLFQEVHACAIGCILCGKDPQTLCLTPDHLELLRQKLEPLSDKEQNRLLHAAHSRLCVALHLTNPPLQAYLLAALPALALRIEDALKHHNLKTVFAIPNTTDPQVAFADAKKMDDDLFREISERIRDCDLVAEKNAILQNEVHSLGDLVDILEADCLFDEEYTAFFATLPTTELSLLCAKLPLDTDDFCDWQTALHTFLEQMNSNQSGQIRALAKQIRLES